MKKLPIGIQNLEEIIQEDYLYVDKTSFAKKMIGSGKHYFLSRPRRFGKSLFLNTLKHIFLGNKKLFKGLAIYESDYQWKAHPVIQFSFSSLNHSSSDQFQEDLQCELQQIAREYSIQLVGTSLEFQLKTLIKELAKSERVVVLVDEYDKPILDHLKEKSLCEENTKVLRSFFGSLKDMDGYLKFTFVTGISRFSRASLFSGFDNLEDISLDTQYADIMGYTERK